MVENIQRTFFAYYYAFFAAYLQKKIAQAKYQLVAEKAKADFLQELGKEVHVDRTVSQLMEVAKIEAHINQWEMDYLKVSAKKSYWSVGA